MGGRVSRFENLIAWQKSRAFAREIYVLVRKDTFRKDPALASQLRRAARSVMGNIAEGFERSGPKEFHKGLSIALGSCAEVRSDLYLLLDVGYIAGVEFDRLQGLGTEVAKIIGGLRASVARSVGRVANKQASTRAPTP